MKKESKVFDIVIIGAGSGGLNIASFANSVGLKVLLIDKEDRAIGGDCLNFGCVPSKALLYVARLVRNGKEAQKFGMGIQGVVDIKKVMKYVDGRKKILRKKENAAYLRSLGMTVVLGDATFSGRNVIEVNGVRYQGKKIIIATGSRPRHLDIEGMDKIRTYNNENIFSIDVLPKKIAIVGAGPIGVEIGQAMSVLGSDVTIIGSKLLDKEDPEIIEVLEDSLRRDGLRLLLGYRSIRVEGGKYLVVSNGRGKEERVAFDMLFESIGRILNVDNLNLEKAGIERDEKGKIVVDEYLRTTNKNVLVCGDVAGGHMFTHAAELHASLIIRNLFLPWKKKINTDAMAWVTYSTPEIATFGLNEKALRERGMAYEVIKKNFSESDYAVINNDISGRIKIIVSKKGIVLGGSIVAPDAGSIAQEWMLAQSNEMNLKDFMKKVYPYPTAARVSRSLVLDRMKRKITPQTKKILQWLFH